MRWDTLSDFDDAVYKLVSGCISDRMTGFMKFISFLGSGWTITALAVAIPLAIFISRKKKFYFFSLICSANIALGALLNQILKYVFHRPRPALLQLVEASGYSFPSGHAMNSLIFYGFLFYFITRHMKHRSKYLIALALALLVLLIGFSRVYLGVHYASDVLAGFILGLGWLILYIRLVNRHFSYCCI